MNKFICNHCKVSFQSYNQDQKCCSIECSRKVRHQKEEIKKICLTCSAEFVVLWFRREQKYCSRECSFPLGNKEIKKICGRCGAPFVVPHNRDGLRRKYCSQQCAWAANVKKRGANTKIWRGTGCGWARQFEEKNPEKKFAGKND
jgi:hypothetical protein